MAVPALPHLIAWTIGALGIAALARLIAKEHRRINDELDKARGVMDKSEQRRNATLKPDPHTGVYRPHQRD